MDYYRRYCIIALLIMSVMVRGQIMIPGVVASSHQSETYEYADADSLTILMDWDLSVYSVADEPLKSTVVAGMPHGGAEDSDSLAGSYVNSMAFEEINGEIVLVSKYDTLQCCVEFLDNNHDAYSADLGAGIHSRLNANTSSTDMRNGFRGGQFQIENVSMTESMKFLGMHRKAVGGNDQRDYLSTLEQSPTPGRFWLKTYDWSFDDGPGDTSMDDVHQHYLTDGMTDTVIFLEGQLYTYFEVWDCGTINGADAWKAIYIDGVCVMRHSGLTWNTTADNLRYPNSNNMELHMGGNSSENFNSLSNGKVYWRNIYNGQFDPGYSEFPDATVMPELDAVIKLPIESGFMDGFEFE